MVIMSTNADEVSIHAVSPLSIFDGGFTSAGAGATGWIAGAAAGSCAKEETCAVKQ
jgi:hypothetical protein